MHLSCSCAQQQVDPGKPLSAAQVEFEWSTEPSTPAWHAQRTLLRALGSPILPCEEDRQQDSNKCCHADDLLNKAKTGA